MKRNILILLLSFLIFSTAHAETIELRSGAFFEGTIIERTETSIKLDTGKRVLSIKTNDIVNILSDVMAPEPISDPKISDKDKTSVEPIEIKATLLETQPSMEEPSAKNVDPDELIAEKKCLTLSSSLETCSPYKCTIEDPLIKGFISEHTIYGIRGDHCLWKQTLPHKGIMRCRLSEKTRKKIATDLKSDLNNSPSLDNAFMNNECRISGY